MGLSRCWAIGQWGDPRENGAKPTNFGLTSAAEGLGNAKSKSCPGASLRTIKNPTVHTMAQNEEQHRPWVRNHWANISAKVQYQDNQIQKQAPRRGRPPQYIRKLSQNPLTRPLDQVTDALCAVVQERMSQQTDANRNDVGSRSRRTQASASLSSQEQSGATSENTPRSEAQELKNVLTSVLELLRTTKAAEQRAVFELTVKAGKLKEEVEKHEEDVEKKS